MGYNIEVSFNLLKNSNVSELEDTIITMAKNSDCTFYYSNCEIEKNLAIQRNHMVITLVFDQCKVDTMLQFIKDMKKIKGIYIESIFNEETNGMIYASQYYLTLIDKQLSKNYKSNKRERSYSEDDIIILHEVKKGKN